MLTVLDVLTGIDGKPQTVAIRTATGDLILPAVGAASRVERELIRAERQGNQVVVASARALFSLLAELPGRPAQYLLPLDLMARLLHGRRQRGRVHAVETASSLPYLVEDFVDSSPRDDYLRHIAAAQSVHRHAAYPALPALIASSENPERLAFLKLHLDLLLLLGAQFAGELHRLRNIHILRAEVLLSPTIHRLCSSSTSGLSVARERVNGLEPHFRSESSSWSTTARSVGQALGLHQPGGRPQVLQGHWTQAGTWTGRVTCSSPPLQSIGDGDRVDLRVCFDPPPGSSFVSLDYRAAELSALRALFAGPDFEPPDLLARCDKTDLYATMYGKGRPDWTALPPPVGLRVRTAWDRAMAAWKETGGWVETLGGRRLVLGPCPACGAVEDDRADCWRCGRPYKKPFHPGVLLNPWLQGSVADLMRAVVPLIEKEVTAVGGALHLIRHDELLCSIPDSKLRNFGAVAAEIMETTHFRCRQKRGKRWDQMVEG